LRSKLSRYLVVAIGLRELNQVPRSGVASSSSGSFSITDSAASPLRPREVVRVCLFLRGHPLGESFGSFDLRGVECGRLSEPSRFLGTSTHGQLFAQ
jgi:hypothetical protein